MELISFKRYYNMFTCLGKVSDNMAALRVCLGHHVEQERLYIIIQRLMVQKELGQETQILTKHLQPVITTAADNNNCSR